MKIQTYRARVTPQTFPMKSADIISYAPPSLNIFPDAVSELDHTMQRPLVQALHLSFVIYDPLTHLEDELKRVGYTDILKLDRRLTGTQGMCCIRDGRAYLVFRGSASPLDWFYDFLCLPFFWPLCHFGFGTAWRSIRGKVKAWLAKHPDVKEFMICGHSLGGGISHMAALELAPEYKIDHVITFGAPKACFLWTADKFDSTKIKNSDKTLHDITHAVVNQRDIVAKVPFNFMGFRDVGQLIYINQKGDIHAGTKAISARSDDSFSDIDLTFSFMEEEKMSAMGPSGDDLQKAYYYIRLGLVKLGTTVPIFKIFITPALTYVLVSLYFMRSGLAHMGDKYMKAWPSSLWADQFKRYEQTGMEKAISLTIRLVLGGILGFGFFYGLYHIGVWSIESFSKKT